MRISYHENFKKALRDFSDTIKKKTKKQIGNLSKNLRHPSLHAKKYDEAQDIWQARVDKGVRMYFSIEGDTYFLLDIKKHNK
ncbi:hypothetical protein A2914_00060 [Candidatus Nomurabacteria bacterium RIFCSPLOWO2_01_FULL_41_21]|uniref:Uncharacterized protein n=2 Tax=Candidatus Nomuraibacteriota TaxID=1752729 RepID=A0A1F6V143_9BACT|nr:MAG: hypothetical protein A2733_00880 [Candidatus Nomurabacteria bacterium RIFCSPHIGHO2_01_FULL_40_20]OGI88684.1 MAG: hypothetical protein A2914_00060 [Candidatus Nomurabacteria bacterium RIFCSPLOWO2_01_FULL_41_21]